MHIKCFMAITVEFTEPVTPSYSKMQFAISISYLFPNIYYMLLKPRHVSLIQTIFRVCTILKGKFIIYVHIKD
jgi:hypothetical protein